MESLKSVCAVLLVYQTMVEFVSGNVVLMGSNVSKSFDDMEANFTPKIKGAGESGVLYLAEPLDACSPLVNKEVGGSKSPFALIIRGGCSFDDKVRSAQNAGFKAAIIYDCEDNAPLVAMGGTSDGIKIQAVFVSKASSEMLKQYANHTEVELWILPTFEDSPWSIMAVSFISLLVMSAVLATCFFVHKHHATPEIPSTPQVQVQEFHGMSRRLVKAMPSLIFTTVLEDNCTSRTCAICLEDYNSGEKLRILPCCHKFHAICVDSWLTTRRTFCPVCKRDARTSINIPPASEATPLLSSVSSSPSPSLLSCNSSLPSSPPLPIITSSPHHITNSYMPYNNSMNSLRNTPSQRSQMPYNNSLRNTPSQRSQMPYLNSSHSLSYSSRYMRPYNLDSSNASPSYLVSPHSIGLPVPSPYSSSRYMQTYDNNNLSSSNASPSYLIGSSGSRRSYLRHCESGASISALASANSLPRC